MLILRLYSPKALLVLRLALKLCCVSYAVCVPAAGMCELGSTMQEGELAVFFRNNHFSTVLKRQVSRELSRSQEREFSL